MSIIKYQSGNKFTKTNTRVNIHTGKPVMTQYEEFLEQRKANQTSEVAEFIKKKSQKQKEQSEVYTDPQSGKTVVQSIGIQPTLSPIDLAVLGVGSLLSGGIKLASSMFDMFVNPLPFNPFSKTQRVIRRFGDPKKLSEFSKELKTIKYDVPTRTFKDKKMNELSEEYRKFKSMLESVDFYKMDDTDFYQYIERKEQLQKQLKEGLAKEYGYPFTSENFLGSGTFGSVYDVPKTKLVVKYGHKRAAQTPESFERLLALRKQIKDPNVALPLHTTVSNDKIIQIMPKIKGKPMTRTSGYTEEDIDLLAKQMTRIREKGVDIDFNNPDNILWDDVNKKFGLVDLEYGDPKDMYPDFYDWAKDNLKSYARYDKPKRILSTAEAQQLTNLLRTNDAQDFTVLGRTAKQNVRDYLNNPIVTNTAERNELLSNRIKKPVFDFTKPTPGLKYPFEVMSLTQNRNKLLNRNFNIDAKILLEGTGAEIDNGTNITLNLINHLKSSKAKLTSHLEHEFLHGAGYGNKTIERLKLEKLLKPESELNMILRNQPHLNELGDGYPRHYLTTLGETQANVYDLLKELKVPVGAKYPGKETVANLLNTSKEKRFVVDALKLEHTRDYKRVWDALTGKYFTAIPLAGFINYKLQQQ